MARPRLGDSDSKRLQMVITAAELEAIEEWQHQNMVPSKSEAIRQLCQIALSPQQNEADDVVKARENRIPIMFSDDELHEIDEWRHENRIATRAGAVRSLCQTGLHGASADTVVQIYKAFEILGAKSDLLGIIGSIGDTQTDKEIVFRLKVWIEQNRPVEQDI
jgi:metal-responsive CopG/Arc/MetJ family transcriptional regulator